MEMIRLEYGFTRKLHFVLLVLFLVGLIQFVIVFHVLQMKNHIASESQLVELLRVVNSQNSLLHQQKHVPAKVFKRRSATDAKQVVSTVAPSRCEVVHVVVVCGGATSARALVTMLKSVLFYRRRPLQLHLVVDAEAERSLRPLFATWHVSHLRVHFYSMAPLEPEVEWIPNTHYSGRYGLMKLVLLKALPVTLTKVICLDTDVMFNADVTELWRMFETFEPKQALGLVENQSSWYLRKRGVWPALGHGFNTGVILMNLDVLRAKNWSKWWKTVAMTYLPIIIKVQLADQDIINAVIDLTPSLVHRLPCQWNVQLNRFADGSATCLQKGVEAKVVHWNSASKQRSSTYSRRAMYFRQLFLSFVAYDGGLLRKEVLGCPEPDVTETEILDYNFRSSINESSGLGSFCMDIMAAANYVYRTHLFYLPFEVEETNSSVDITFVTQLSLDRILMLENLATQWSGQISAAVFASDAEVQTLVDFVTTSTVLRSRKNIAYHVVYKEGTDSQGLYPVNYLRNVAMAQVATDFVLLADVDFAPKMRMREYVTDVIVGMNLTRRSKVALVIPPFETSLHRFPLPITKRVLLSLWERNLVLPFRLSMWKPGQFSVNFSKWKTANSSYEVDWTVNFEPYFVISRDAPRFDTRFVGFGWNKVAHSMTLNAEKYKFVVLPEAFLVHLPHSPSISNSKFRQNYHYRRCMSQVKKIFLDELNAKHGVLVSYNVTQITKLN